MRTCVCESTATTSVVGAAAAVVDGSSLLHSLVESFQECVLSNLEDTDVPHSVLGLIEMILSRYKESMII